MQSTKVPVMLPASFCYNFLLGRPQTILLAPHPQVTTPICLFFKLRRRNEVNCRLFVWFGIPAEDGRAKVHLPLESGSESRGWRVDVESGTVLCGLRLNVGHTSAGLQKQLRKALAESKEYLQLKYWSDYIICGALQANLFAAFSICHSVSMVSRLVRDGIFKPDRQSLKLKS